MMKNIINLINYKFNKIYLFFYKNVLEFNKIHKNYKNIYKKNLKLDRINRLDQLDRNK